MAPVCGLTLTPTTFKPAATAPLTARVTSACLNVGGLRLPSRNPFFETSDIGGARDEVKDGREREQGTEDEGEALHCLRTPNRRRWLLFIH
jgi:hypothetical protein